MRRFHLRLLLILLIAAGSLLYLFAHAALSAAPVTINDTTVPPVPNLSSQTVSQGAALYKGFCTSCHVANLEGVPDWKKPLPDGSFPAPPHNSSGHTWHHPDAVLLDVIAKGGDPASSSTMPGYKDTLTQEEMRAILDYFRSVWGKDEREYQ